MITPTNGIAAMMMLTNGNAAVIIDNWRRNHEFVIIASSFLVLFLGGSPHSLQRAERLQFWRKFSARFSNGGLLFHNWE